MPFTPYHIGPTAFLGLLFKRWIDLPVFLLVNVVVDMEVLVIMFFDLGFPKHRYFHTFLIGGLVGAIFGLGAYPLRWLFAWGMNAFCVPYKTGLRKMVISGVLGAWLHVLIDGLCHYDVLMFWPNRYRLFLTLQRRLGWNELIQGVEVACLAFFVPAMILYVLNVVSYCRSRSAQRPDSNDSPPANNAS